MENEEDYIVNGTQASLSLEVNGFKLKFCSKINIKVLSIIFRRFS
jgi:hypothetical protein